MRLRRPASISRTLLVKRQGLEVDELLIALRLRGGSGHVFEAEVERRPIPAPAGRFEVATQHKGEFLADGKA